MHRYEPFRRNGPSVVSTAFRRKVDAQPVASEVGRAPLGRDDDRDYSAPACVVPLPSAALIVTLAGFPLLV